MGDPPSHHGSSNIYFGLITWMLKICTPHDLGNLRMVVSRNTSTPSHHPFLDGIVHDINQPAIGYPHDFGNPISSP